MQMKKTLMGILLFLSIVFLGSECEYVVVEPTLEPMLEGTWQICEVDSLGVMHYDLMYWHQKWLLTKHIHFYNNNKGEVSIYVVGEDIPYDRSASHQFTWTLSDNHLVMNDENRSWLDDIDTDISFDDTIMYWTQKPNFRFIRR